MARGGVGFEGIGAEYVTVQAHGSVSSVALVSGASAVEGKAVTVTGNGQMGYGTAGDPLRGIIQKYEDDGNMTVQVKGFKEGVPGISGALPAANDFLCVNGAGAVSKVASGNNGPAYAVSVDSTANTVVVFIG
jgi:hypothetical protein